jgi:hypothetical protein
MSQQPPEGAYAQPQDPWEGGYEPGLASVPTDPIPEQRFEGYPPADLWSQQTVAQGGYVPQRSPNRTGMIVLIVIIVLVLGGGGGYAAYYVTSKRNATTDPTGGPSASGQATSTATTPPAQFDPYAVKPDDCIRNNSGNVPDPNTVDPNPQIEIVPCTTEESYKVVKIVKGEELLENPDGKLDQNTTAPAACKDTGYKFWYAYDATDNTQDLFFCLVSAADAG